MLAEACQTATFCLEDTQNKYTLKHRHDYYYQIQCQLYCVDCDWCDLVVKTEQDIHIERIYRDKKWWELNLEKFILIHFCRNWHAPVTGRVESGSQSRKLPYFICSHQITCM